MVDDGTLRKKFGDTAETSTPLSMETAHFKNTDSKNYISLIRKQFMREIRQRFIQWQRATTIVMAEQMASSMISSHEKELKKLISKLEFQKSLTEKLLNDKHEKYKAKRAQIERDAAENLTTILKKKKLSMKRIVCRKTQSQK